MSRLILTALADVIAAKFDRAGLEALSLYGSPNPMPGTLAHDAREFANGAFKIAEDLRRWTR